MLEKERLKEIISFAQDNNLSWIEVDGIKFPVPPKEQEITPNEEQEMKLAHNPEPEYTEEEILYYATPYFDDLQERKRIAKEQKEMDESLREEHGKETEN